MRCECLSRIPRDGVATVAPLNLAITCVAFCALIIWLGTVKNVQGFCGQMIHGARIVRNHCRQMDGGIILENASCVDITKKKSDEIARRIYGGMVSLAFASAAIPPTT